MELAERVMAAESYVVQRWDYTSIPESVIQTDNKPRKHFLSFSWVR
jgi:hypothetical protein